MKHKRTKTSVPQLHELIKAEIAGSGLDVASGFFKALDSYANHYKLKGRQADTVKAYLTTAAIHIAKADKGIFFSGPESQVITPSHAMAGVWGFHPPPYDPNDPCRKAVVEIQRLENVRRKGTAGILGLSLSNYLDDLKA